MSKISLHKGRIGEERAVEFLEKQGYQIIERNFKKRYGEIDIICLDFLSDKEPVLVFVEVKARYTYEYGHPEEAVTLRKIKNLLRSAESYKLLHPELPKLMRIDVVSIELSEEGKVKSIKQIKNITQ